MSKFKKGDKVKILDNINKDLELVEDNNKTSKFKVGDIIRVDWKRRDGKKNEDYSDTAVVCNVFDDKDFIYVNYFKYTNSEYIGVIHYEYIVGSDEHKELIAETVVNDEPVNEGELNIVRDMSQPSPKIEYTESNNIDELVGNKEVKYVTPVDIENIKEGLKQETIRKFIDKQDLELGRYVRSLYQD